MDLMAPSLHGASQTLIVTKEGLSVSVSTNLLKMFSSTLTFLLDLPPCISTSIIIPDCSLNTLSNLLEILTKGYSRNVTDEENSRDTIEDIKDVAGLLGIRINSLYFGGKSKEYVLRKAQLTRKLLEDQILKKYTKNVVPPEPSAENLEVMEKCIKTEDQDLSSTFQCVICSKTFKSAVPLGYHY